MMKTGAPQQGEPPGLHLITEKMGTKITAFIWR